MALFRKIRAITSRALSGIAKFLKKTRPVVVFLGLLLGIVASWAAIQAAYFPAPKPQAIATAPPASTSSAPHYDGAWGPSRDGFTAMSPPPYVVLNSVIDDFRGDQRDFVRVRLASDYVSDGFDRLRAKPGDVLAVSVGVFNNASTEGPTSTIHGLAATFDNPDPMQSPSIKVTLNAKNATSVWDGATVLTSRRVTPKYVSGTTYFQTGQNVIRMPDTFGAGTPTLLGWDTLNGELPIGYDKGPLGEGYIHFQLKVVAV